MQSDTQRRLDVYARDVLACPPEVARAGGVHVLEAPLRGRPAWHGYTMPLVALSFEQGAVIAVRPDSAGHLTQLLGSDTRLPTLDGAARRRLHRAARQVFPYSYSLDGDARVADAATFDPYRDQQRAELIPRDDPAAAHLRHRFDGEIFGVRGPRGRLVSWAALKVKSDDVWEIAVTTDPDHRGRGLARAVVSAATEYTLRCGRLPLYIHDRENHSSAFVCRSLGYRLYAEIVLVEY